MERLLLGLTAVIPAIAFGLQAYLGTWVGQTQVPITAALLATDSGWVESPFATTGGKLVVLHNVTAGAAAVSIVQGNEQLSIGEVLVANPVFGRPILRAASGAPGVSQSQLRIDQLEVPGNTTVAVMLLSDPSTATSSRPADAYVSVGSKPAGQPLILAPPEAVVLAFAFFSAGVLVVVSWNLLRPGVKRSA